MLAPVSAFRLSCGAIVALVLLSCATSGRTGQVQVLDLDGRRVDPLQAAPSVKAIVFVFASIECPMSNRYSPEVRRLYETFAPKGVLFWLVYPNPGDTPDSIRDHRKAFGYPMAALRDPRQEFVRLANVTVTPEASVFDRGGRIIYRGRIDDRYVDFGVDRQAPSSHDLEDALAATLAGKTVPHPTTRAIGCTLADFLR